MVTWKALDALSHQLELCGVDTTTAIVAVLPPDGRPDLETIRTALARSGADTIEIWAATSDDAPSPLLRGALDAADLVISFLPPGADLPVPAGGALLRVPSASLPLDDYRPHIQQRQRSEALVGALIHAAQHGEALRLTDSAGTLLEVELARAAVVADPGVLDATTREASFPAGWVEITPARSKVSGQVVLLPGDANVARGQAVRSPIRLDVQDDRICAIDGDHADADVLRAQLEHANNEHAYGFASLTIGLNPGGGPLALFDERLNDAQLGRLAAGVVTVAFGTNLVADRPGGQVLPLSLPRRTLTIGDLPIILDGELNGDFAPDIYELG